jgi:hypothetical protein
MRNHGRIPLLFGVLWAVFGGVGCSSSGGGGTPVEVFFDSGLARAERDSAVRVELYLVESCGSIALGDRPVPAFASTSVVRDGERGSFGSSVPDGSFGLYGIAQDANCAVVAAGCAPVALDETTSSLAVTLSSLIGEGCSGEQTCSITAGTCSAGSGGSGGAGGTGGAGGQPSTRVDAGLILLYEFDEGSGTTVADRSGVSPSHDLTIANPDRVTWATDYLSVDSGTSLSTDGAATKVVSSAQASGELTMEAWVKPASSTQSGPARIMSMALDTEVCNFFLGQQSDAYAVRFRASGRDDSETGRPTVLTTPGTATTLLTHVVYTRAADGSEVLYVDGEQDVSFTRSGGLNQWNLGYPLFVASGRTGGQTWIGELHLIAVYDRALEAGEVRRNFAVGP